MGFANSNGSFSLFPPLPTPRVQRIRHLIIGIPRKSDFRCHSGAFQPEDEFAFRGKLDFNEKSRPQLESSLRNEEKTMSTRNFEGGGLARLEGVYNVNKRGCRGGKQIVKRSDLVAKQVICIQSALGLGFISQLWIDPTSWVVVVVEVKPALLSGESDRFLLKDIVQVGDVALVEDEAVLDNEFKMVGFQTLVGYTVVTTGQRSIGKVRGYIFNVSSGIVESLELDSFGVSFIPSSLVSTYILRVEDIVKVFSDVVVVQEAAASGIQRLTKGLWDAQLDHGYHGREEIEERERSDRRRRKPRDRRSSRSRRKMRDRDESDDDGWGIFS